jgi:putative tryptophan/tyrosine transport system substrate-binding protein
LLSIWRNRTAKRPGSARPPTGCGRKARNRRLIPWLCLLALLGLQGWQPACRAMDEIVIVYDPANDSHVQAVDALEAHLDSTPRPGLVHRKLDLADLEETHRRDPGMGHTQLVVSVGARAAVLTSRGAWLRVPHLYTLLPRAMHERIRKARKETLPVINETAVYIDQPFERRLALLRAALPRHQRVGVLLGPWSRDSLDELRDVVREPLQLRSTIVEDEAPLVGPLNQLLRESDVLMAIPDPVAFNRYNIQSILLTTYRYRIPVIGFSRNYVDAGALMALYSTPAQIGRQTAELIVRLAKRGNWALPPPQYPIYFALAVNRQVARSLGLALADEESLLKQLRESSRREDVP